MSRAGRTAVAATLATAVAVATGACGKRGDLEAPEGTVYPRAYPAPETMVPPAEGEAEAEE